MTNIYVVTVHILFGDLPDHITLRVEAADADQAEDIARQRAREDNYIFLSAFARKEEQVDEQADRRAEQAGESVGAV